MVLDDWRFWRRVVQWCSGAHRRFWRFPAVRKKVEKEEKKTQRAATAIVEKRREKNKKEKGGEGKYNCLKSKE
jgi:hypothetical protein